MSEQPQAPHGGLSPNFRLADSLRRDMEDTGDFELPKAVEAAQRITHEIQLLEHENLGLKELATKDPLTSLLNRRGLEEAYAVMRETSLPDDRRHASKHRDYALITDVDDFKTINDTKGHEEGDRILKVLAESTQKHVRKHDAVGRWGGDENVVLLPHITRERAHNVAQALVEEARAMGITISVGVGKLNFRNSLEKTINEADSALRAAKKAGKNIVVNLDQLGEIPT